MRALFQRRPVFCTAYLLVFVVLFAGCAWQLSDALIGAYWSVNPNKPPDFAINPEPGRVESLVGMIKFFANGGSLDSKLLAGTSWPSILRERFGLTSFPRLACSYRSSLASVSRLTPLVLVALSYCCSGFTLVWHWVQRTGRAPEVLDSFN